MFDLEGKISSVLGQCYRDPCIFWTGKDLLVAEAATNIWECYSPKEAKGEAFAA